MAQPRKALLQEAIQAGTSFPISYREGHSSLTRASRDSFDARGRFHARGVFTLWPLSQARIKPYAVNYRISTPSRHLTPAGDWPVGFVLR